MCIQKCTKVEYKATKHPPVVTWTKVSPNCPDLSDAEARAEGESVLLQYHQKEEKEDHCADEGCRCQFGAPGPWIPSTEPFRYTKQIVKGGKVCGYTFTVDIGLHKRRIDGECFPTDPNKPKKAPPPKKKDAKKPKKAPKKHRASRPRM